MEDRTALLGGLVLLICLVVAFAGGQQETTEAEAPPELTEPVESSGNITAYAVGLYWDHNLTEEMSQIDWGVMSPGETKNVSFYLLNMMNGSLRMNTSDWLPVNKSHFFTVTFSHENQTVVYDTVVPVWLALTVSPDVEGVDEFFFNIWIGVVA